MKHIVIVSAVFHPEPVTSAMMNYDLALELSKSYKVTVLRPFPSRPLRAEYSIEGITYPFSCITLNSYRCPESKLVGRLQESFSFGRACKRYIKEHKEEIDFVYNDGWQILGLYIVAKECVKLNIPYIVPIQDIYPESLFTHRHIPNYVRSILSSLILPFDRYYQKHACRVRTISTEMAEYISRTRNVELGRFLVLDNWQNDDEFYYTPITNERTIFGYVGSINAHSNTELIIKAFANANIPDTELRIYGGGNHKDICVELVKNLGLNNVIFDEVEKTQVPKVQAKMNVLILALPTGNGGLCLPSKMTSYMLSGRPVLASVESSTTMRYINESDCGITVEPDNIKALAEGFRKFASMSIEEQNRLGRNSRLFAEKRLLKSVNLEKLCESINNELN